MELGPGFNSLNQGLVQVRSDDQHPKIHSPTASTSFEEVRKTTSVYDRFCRWLAEIRNSSGELATVVPSDSHQPALTLLADAQKTNNCAGPAFQVVGENKQTPYELTPSTRASIRPHYKLKNCIKKIALLNERFIPNKNSTGDISDKKSMGDPFLYREVLPIVVDEKKCHFHAERGLAAVFEEWKKSKSACSFQTYVALKAVKDKSFKQELLKHKVEYLSEQREGELTCSVGTDGVLSQQGIPMKPGKYAFALFGDVLRAAPKEHDRERGNIQHSSFFQGKAVDSAGFLEIDESGKIKMIINESGHYLPTKNQVANMLRYLDGKGIDTAKSSIQVQTSRFSSFIGTKIAYGISNAIKALAPLMRKTVSVDEFRSESLINRIWKIISSKT